jgi:hypothetical protein
MLQPTVTQRVRAFLDAEGARLAPWATLDDTYARLYALLAERRDDPGFWAPLGKLMGALAAEAAATSSASVAELLGRAEIERLTAELRRALPGRSPDGAIRPLAEFTAALAAPALCAFLLLGLAAAAAGCTGIEEASAGPAPPPREIPAVVPPAGEPAPPAQLSPPDEKAAPEAAAADAAWFDGCALPEKGLLWRSIDRAALGAEDKRALCDCFSALDRRWTNRLTYLFRNGKPTEIAKALEEMVACCAAEDKAADAACGKVAKTHAAVQERTSSVQVVGHALYKGVCFD